MHTIPRSYAIISNTAIVMFRRSTAHYTEGSDIPPCNLSKAGVEKYAGVVAQKAGLHVAASNGKLLSDLVEPFGGRIRVVDLDEWFGENGSIFVHGPFDFDIVLPAYTSPLRTGSLWHTNWGTTFFTPNKARGPS